MAMTQKQKESSWNGLFHRLFKRCNYDFDLAVAISFRKFGNGCANYASSNKELILNQASHAALLRAEHAVRFRKETTNG